MSCFRTKLWLEDTGDGEHWIVCAPFEYESTLLHGIVVVPVGAETDLASVPRLVRGMVPKSGKYSRAAVLHDAGYRGTLRTVTGERINLIKPLCDKLFLEAMELAGVGKVQRQLMFRAVRRFSKKVHGP